MCYIGRRAERGLIVLIWHHQIPSQSSITMSQRNDQIEKGNYWIMWIVITIINHFIKRRRKHGRQDQHINLELLGPLVHIRSQEWTTSSYWNHHCQHISIARYCWATRMLVSGWLWSYPSKHSGNLTIWQILLQWCFWRWSSHPQSLAHCRKHDVQVSFERTTYSFFSWRLVCREGRGQRSHPNGPWRACRSLLHTCEWLPCIWNTRIHDADVFLSFMPHMKGSLMILIFVTELHKLGRYPSCWGLQKPKEELHSRWEISTWFHCHWPINCSRHMGKRLIHGVLYIHFHPSELP